MNNDFLSVDNNVNELLKDYKKEDIDFYKKLLIEKDEYDLSTKIDYNFQIKEDI